MAMNRTDPDFNIRRALEQCAHCIAEARSVHDHKESHKQALDDLRQARVLLGLTIQAFEELEGIKVHVRAGDR
jgi:hypothetical protein